MKGYGLEEKKKKKKKKKKEKKKEIKKVGTEIIFIVKKNQTK